MKQKYRIAITLGIGFAIAMLIMSIAIYFGYSGAYRAGGNTHEVYLLGLNIYYLKLAGSKYVGSTNGPIMGTFCAIIMVVSVAVEESLYRIRNSQKGQ